MKRIILILSLCWVSTNMALGQFQFGIKAGINSSNISLKQLISDKNEASQKIFEQKKLGHQIGIFTRISLLGLYAEPNILYYRSKFELNIDDQNNIYQLHEINIPLYVGLRLNPIRIFGGPVIYLEDHQISDLGSQVSMQFKESNYGFQSGVGLDTKKIKLEIIYENISHSRILRNVELQISENMELSKSSRISFLFGFKF